MTFEEFLVQHREHDDGRMALEAIRNPETGLIAVFCPCGCRWLGTDLRAGPGWVVEPA